MRKTPITWLAATVATAGVTLAVTSLPASAAPASGPAFGPFGMTPSPAASGLPRSYFSFAVQRGQPVSDSVVVTNLSDRPERLRLIRSEGETAANSGSAYQNVTGRCLRSSCWISGLPHVIVLAPKERRLVGFTVRVPRRVRAGQYLAGITLLAAKKPRPVKVGSRGHASAKAIIIDEVTVGVAVTIGNLAALRSRLRIGQPSAGWIGRVVRLSIPVRNTGQTFLHATGRIRCQAGGRWHSYRVIMDTVLPGGNALLAVNARGLRAGSLPCAARLRTGSGALARWSGAVSLAAQVVTRTYHPSKGVYVSVPEPGIPFWAIALIVLGVLIFGALMALMVRQRRPARRGRPSRGHARPARSHRRRPGLS